MELAVEKYKLETEPYYLPINQEVELFEAAYEAKLPAMLKGPTGCGKTRFVEYMAYKLDRPLITVACHEDLSSTDLVGRFLLTRVNDDGGGRDKSGSTSLSPVPRH